MTLHLRAVSYVSALLIMLVLVGLLVLWWDSYTVLAALTGAPVGWALGILLAPYAPEEKRFSRWSKSLFGFLGGVAVTKVSDVLVSLSGSSKGDLWNEVLIRRVLVGFITFLVTTIVVFVARTYQDVDQEVDEDDDS